MLVSNGADAFLYPVRRKAPLHQALQASLADQLGLSERFDRWRFLQKVLDEEVAAEPTNQLLFQVLEGYLKYPRPVVAGSDLTGSPERTLERVQRVADVVQRAAGETSIPLVSDINDDDDNDENNNHWISILEDLLPDPVEEEDDHKGTWDTLMELHGRESVKWNQQNPSTVWNTRCLATRLLIYYDFLSLGVVDTPLDGETSDQGAVDGQKKKLLP